LVPALADCTTSWTTGHARVADERIQPAQVCVQASTRFVYEVPGGVKAGMKWLYVNALQDAAEQCSTWPQWSALLYAIAYLHVTVRQRSALGPPAWNAPYDCALDGLVRAVRSVQNHADVEVVSQ